MQDRRSAPAAQASSGSRWRPQNDAAFETPRFRISLLPAVGYAVRFTPSASRIGFAFETQTGAHAFGSDRMRPFRARANSLAYTPAGCDIASESPRGGEYLTLELLRPMTTEPPRQFTGRAAPSATPAARALRRALLSRTPLDQLALDAAIQSLLAAALLDPSDQRDDAAEARSMTERRLRIVEDLVEARLGAPLTVCALASELGLSTGFFRRAFKAATGQAPHDYVIERRVARARRRIETTRRSLAAIAAECGFASQAHMTTQMRARLGLTPGALRNGTSPRLSSRPEETR